MLLALFYIKLAALSYSSFGIVFQLVDFCKRSTCQRMNGNASLKQRIQK